MSLRDGSRRNFLKLLGVTGGGLVVGVNLSGCGGGAAENPIETASGEFSPNAFLQITPAGEIRFYSPSVEMGQGATTGLATLVAEELNTPPERIEVIFAGPHEAYSNPLIGMQITGGSTSIAGFFQPLRQAAANARETLRAAAAQSLNVDIGAVEVADGTIRTGAEAHGFGEFAELAATLVPVANALLKKPADYRYIGKYSKRVDAIAKVTGTAQFGIDVELPDMRKVAIKRCPVVGGKIKSFNSDTVQGLPGVEALVEVFNGVAVVAENYWDARAAADALDIEWELPSLANYDTEAVFQEMVAALDNDDGKEAQANGDFVTAFSAAEHTHEGEYRLPYLAHATMEPMNCAAVVTDDRCEVWTGTQGPGTVQGIAARYAGLSTDQVIVHPLYLGGGFGRRANVDYVIEAVQVAAATRLPVQVVWSREDDMRHDYYRPASVVRLQAGVDAQGQITAWRADRAGGNIMPHTLDEGVEALTADFLPLGLARWVGDRTYGVFANWTVDHSSIEGLAEDYEFPNREIYNHTVDAGLRLGFWRAVGASANPFAKESFVDELADKLGIDPVALRLKNTGHNPRMRAVIERLAQAAGWGKALAPGHFQGIAVQQSFGSYVGEVAEVSVDSGKITVHRVTCVVDCGMVVNPDIVRAQMESGIIYGMTAALTGRIDLRNGVVLQGNFHDYPILRMHESPEIDVHIIASNEPPTGVGEPGLPPIAPAIANAVFAATGQRLRELPLTLA